MDQGPSLEEAGQVSRSLGCHGLGLYEFVLRCVSVLGWGEVPRSPSASPQEGQTKERHGRSQGMGTEF